MRLIFVLFALFVAVKTNVAQINIVQKQQPHFVFTWDNDVLFYTDYYYSQGLFFRLSIASLDKNPINYLLLSFPNSTQSYSISVIQQMYTPLEIRDSVVRIDDRPYAGTLYIRSEKLSINNDKRIILRSSLDLGVRGQYSFAQYAQYYYHKIGHIVLPQGWQYQMSDLPVINYNLAAIKQIYYYHNSIEINALSEFRLGTMFTDFALGASAKFGLFDNVFSENKRNKIELSAELAASIRYVAYNGTMQGELKNNPNIHEIKRPYIETLVGSYSAIAAGRYRNFEIDFEWVFITPEFEMGKEHRYNRLSLCFYF